MPATRYRIDFPGLLPIHTKQNHACANVGCGSESASENVLAGAVILEDGP